MGRIASAMTSLSVCCCPCILPGLDGRNICTIIIAIIVIKCYVATTPSGEESTEMQIIGKRPEM